MWTPSHGRAKVGRPARTYIQQLCVDTGCSPEDLLGAMNDRKGWRERVGVTALMARYDDDDDDFVLFFCWILCYHCYYWLLNKFFFTIFSVFFVVTYLY